MYPFEYLRAQSTAQALSALRAHPEGKLLAGGMTLLPTMKNRLAAPSHVIDIGRLPELRGVELQGTGAAARLSIGAGMRHQEIADHELVRQHLPALAALAQQIGDAQVRARGTLGGSVANNDPAADYPAAVLGLGAALLALSEAGERRVQADDFFLGMFSTALNEGELLTRIEFPVPRRAAYAKFVHPASGYAMTGVLVADFGDSVRVAVTGAGAGVFRWTEAEQALVRNFSGDALKGLSHSSQGLNADIHAPAEYRANLIAEMTRRAVQSLASK